MECTALPDRERFGCLRNNSLSGLLMRREATVSFSSALSGILDVTTLGKEPLRGQTTGCRPRASCSVLGWLSSHSDIFSGRRELAQGEVKGCSLKIKAISGLSKQNFGHANHHLRETSNVFQTEQTSQGMSAGILLMMQTSVLSLRAQLLGYQNIASPKRHINS